jgi:chromosome segregation ATPase
MPKPAPADRPRARSGPGEAVPSVLIDDLVAERNSPPLPPEPVFTVDLVEAEGGRRGRRYVAELEELAGRNARAAAEARRIALEQRRHLEVAARGRLEAEREISKLQRELRGALAEQARLTARQELRSGTPLGPSPSPSESSDRAGRAPARSELTRLRETIEQQQELLGQHREQLASALKARDEARLETRRATDACGRAEQSLARSSEMLRRSAIDETARLTGTETPTTGVPAAAAPDRDPAAATDARIRALSDELDRLTRATVDLERARHALEARVAAAEGVRDALETRAAAADGERDHLHARVEELAARLRSATTERDVAHATIAELRQRVATAPEVEAPAPPVPAAVSARDDETADPADLRRSLLADLSALAASPVHRTDT